MVEYFERRAFGKHIDASRLFLYKVTRQLIGFTGDDGAYLRDTMKVLVLFGVPRKNTGRTISNGSTTTLPASASRMRKTTKRSTITDWIHPIPPLPQF